LVKCIKIYNGCDLFFNFKPLHLFYLILLHNISFSLISSQDTLGYRSQFQLALEHYKASRFQLAEEKFHSILTIHKDYIDPVSQLMIAKCQYRQMELEKAYRSCKSYLFNYPNSPYEEHVLTMMGDILLSQNQVSSAFERYLSAFSTAIDTVNKNSIRERIVKCIANDINPHILEGLLFKEKDEKNKNILNLARAYGAWKDGNRYDLELALRGRRVDEFKGRFRYLFKSLQSSLDGEIRSQTTIAVALPITGFDTEKSLSYLFGLSEFVDHNSALLSTRFLVFNTGGNDVKTFKIIRDIIQNKNITAILGPLSDTNILIASGLSRTLPILVPKTELAEIADITQNVFFLTPSDKIISKRIAQILVNEHKYKKIAILSPGDLKSVRKTKFFISELNQLGIEPVVIEWYYGKPENISRQFKSIRKKAWSLVPEKKISEKAMGMSIDSLEGLFDVDVNDFFDFPDVNQEGKMSKKDSSKVVLNTIQALYLPILPDELTYVGTQIPMYNLSLKIIGNENWIDIDNLNQAVIGPHVQGLQIISDVRYSNLPDDVLRYSNFLALGYDHGDFINSISEKSFGSKRSFLQNLRNKGRFQGQNSSISFGGVNHNINQIAEVLEYRSKTINSLGTYQGDSIRVTLP
tara:strand:+ start:229 stop:2136 length:1908 start_codon:yes stop_codon:yes gene_type:complete